MSGPKISVYSLTGRSREILYGQMQCDRQSVICINQIESMLGDLKGIEVELQKSLEILELLHSKTGEKEQEIQDVMSLISTISRDVAGIRNDFLRSKPKITGDYQITESAYSTKQLELQRIQTIKDKLIELHTKALYAKSLGKEEGKREQRRAEQVIVEYLSGDKPETIANYSQKDQEEIRKRIAADVSAVISFEEISDARNNQDDSFDARKRLVKEKIESLFELELPCSFVREISAARDRLMTIKDDSYLNTFEKVSIRSLCRRIEEYQIKAAAENEQFTEKIEQYKVLYKLISGESKSIPKFKDSDEVENAISELEKTVYKQCEQTYISESVDEVLVEMGYDLIGRREVKKRNGKYFRNELYEFSEGTAINVTYSSDGQISMELGGLSHEDRIPTEAESSILTDDMEDFCDEFAIFEKKLRERGIIVNNRLALLPPNVEYATIINVDDYDIEEAQLISEISTKTRRKRTTENKAKAKGVS